MCNSWKRALCLIVLTFCGRTCIVAGAAGTDAQPSLRTNAECRILDVVARAHVLPPCGDGSHAHIPPSSLTFPDNIIKNAAAESRRLTFVDRLCKINSAHPHLLATHI